MQLYHDYCICGLDTLLVFFFFFKKTTGYFKRKVKNSLPYNFNKPNLGYVCSFTSGDKLSDQSGSAINIPDLTQKKKKKGKK